MGGMERCGNMFPKRCDIMMSKLPHIVYPETSSSAGIPNFRPNRVSVFSGVPSLPSAVEALSPLSLISPLSLSGSTARPASGASSSDHTTAGYAPASLACGGGKEASTGHRRRWKVPPLLGWLVGWSAGWVVGWSGGLVGGWVGWLGGWVVGWLGGWLVG